MFKRILDLRGLLERKSVLLLGPRMTGKSTLLRTLFPDALLVDLLHGSMHRQLAARPESLEELVRGNPRPGPVVIDEIQKLPALLDEVHRLIEAVPELRFVLTGSSARKLERAGTNLLGGRATRAHLFPLVWPERPAEVPTTIATQLGGLPVVLRSTDPRAELLDYVGLYPPR